MYPLNMKLPTPAIGFAVANDEAEHQALTASGYEPKYVAPPATPGAAPVAPDADPAEADTQGHTVASVRAALDAAGIAYSKNLGLARLIALLPA